MNALQKTLAIVAFLALASQTVRHAYRLWWEPRGSSLDKYDRPLKDEIGGATSLEELLRRYDKVRKEVDEKRQELEKAGAKDQPYVNELQTEPYKSEHALRDAITQWEKESQEIHELRFYWLVAFVFLVLGIFTYKKTSRWLGLTLLMVAFSEFIYWTSPTFLGTGVREFDRLLLNKLVFTILSLLLLITVIWRHGVFGEKAEAS